MTEIEERRHIIASRIREARKMSGLSQAQVAKMMGLHRPSVSEAEAGNRKVSAEEIAELANIYDVSASWLLGEGVDKLDIEADQIQLAARELQKLKKDDLNKLLKLLALMRAAGDSN